MAWAQALDADPSKLNVNGGACALGHPLGATGAKLMTTLVYELQRSNKRFGLQVRCRWWWVIFRET
jgi:acetyl-CoA acetyltransferase